ncbi:MAG: ATP-binding protein [Actinomycetota bacterium]
MKSPFRTLSPAPVWQVVAIALLTPAVATAIALPLRDDAIAAVLYLFAVVLAATIGSTRSGVSAAAISFLLLNYFFTQPRHTFRVASTEDVVALVIFLAVSVIVGLLVARAWEDRERAQRRERETLLVATLTNGLLSAAPLDSVLGDFASEVAELFRLAGCRLRVDGEEGPIDVGIWPESPAGDGRPELQLALVSASGSFGSLFVAREPGEPSFDGSERRLFESLAKQVVLGLERARLNREVGDARLEAETNRARAALFSSVTHDLRSPLSSIKASVTALLQEDVEYGREQQRDLLQTVLEETDRLNRLVGNLLDLARARAGALVPQKQVTHVEDIVGSVLLRMRPVLSGHDVRTIFRPDVRPAAVDPLQIDQVVSNVLENAARHSPPGSEIRITASMWRSAVQLRIADQGPGIPLEERELVFETFHRGRADGGTGLGLAIAGAIVEAHGGRIWAEGAPGGGTAIVIELPAGKDEEVEPK